MNRNFGKLIGNEVTFAPDIIRVDGHDAISPSEEQLLAAGWKRVKDVAPETDEKHYAVATGWAETDAEIVRTYEVREVEPTVRKWTPLTLKRGAVARGWWEAFKAILTAADGYEDFVMCQFVAEDDPMFAPIKAALAAQFGADAVDGYLAELPTED